MGLAIVENSAEREQSACKRSRSVYATSSPRPKIASGITWQHDDWKTLCPVRFHDIEQILVTKLAFPTDECNLIGVQDYGSAFGAAIGCASVNSAGQLK